MAAVETVGDVVLVAHLGDVALGQVFGFVRGDTGDAGLQRGGGVDGAGEGELHGPAGPSRVLLQVARGHDGSEYTHVVEVCGHPLLRSGGLACLGAPFDVGALDPRVEGDALFDVHLEAGPALVDEGDGVADLALEGDIGDEAPAGDGVGSRPVSETSGTGPRSLLGAGGGPVQSTERAAAPVREVPSREYGDVNRMNAMSCV